MGIENIREKKVYIELDKKREIRFDLNALAELQEVYGTFEKAIADTQNEKISLKAMKALLYAGLKHEDEKLTLKSAGSLVKIPHLSLVTQKIHEALKANFPDPEDEIFEQEIEEDGFTPGDAPVKKK